MGLGLRVQDSGLRVEALDEHNSLEKSAGWFEECLSGHPAIITQVSKRRAES